MTLAFLFAAAAEGEDLLDQRRGPLAGPADLVQAFSRRVEADNVHARQSAVRHDDGQKIVEIMGNATGQPANGFHLLPPPKLQFRALPAPGRLCDEQKYHDRSPARR